MAVTKKQQTPAPAAGVNPKFELAEKAGSYVLRLALPDLTKSDFRVQVDGAGKLTVRGTKTGTLGSPSLHKVFQLPSDASLNDIAGRFEGGVLTLTVPKRATGAAAPTSIEEIKKMPGVTKDTKPKEEVMAKEDSSSKKAMDEATKKTGQQQKQEEEASKSKLTQVKKEEVKPKAPQAPSTTPPQEPALVKKQEEMKTKAPQAAAAAAAAATPPAEKPAPKPEAAAGSEKVKPAVGQDSLAERVRQLDDEEQHAKAAADAAEKEAKEAYFGGWKERATGQLKGLTNMKWAEGLTDMKWADGVVEAARNNKEVVAIGIAAFSLGFLVSHKLFRK